MSGILSLRDLSFEGKRVLIRVDFNVPLTDDGAIIDDTRIQASLPTLRFLMERGATLILMSHLGRPKGVVDKKLSLAPCARHLAGLLGKEVFMAPDCVGSEVQQMVESLKTGEILLLENLRFHEAETKPEKDPSFAQFLASLADCYVNEAFSASHRSHSSITGITKYFPQNSAAGFLLEKEIHYLGSLMAHPKHPFYAFIGGAKVSSKIGILESLCEKVDALFIGGAMVFTFLKAQGIAVGNSLWEEAHIATAKRLMESCKQKNIPLFFPTDTVVSETLTSGSSTYCIRTQEGIPEGMMGVDIGEQTILRWTEELGKAGTVLWNGPFGVYEDPLFAKGTNAIAQALGQIKAVTVVGGGDSVAALKATGADRFISHISTGGGACLEYIQFGTLPGIEHLTRRVQESEAR